MAPGIYGSPASDRRSPGGLQVPGLPQPQPCRSLMLGLRPSDRPVVGRPNALQHACWGRAMDGDVKAVGVVLRVMDQRVRLLGLDRVQQEVDQPRTLVIGGTRRSTSRG